jgi:LCP family protein required for cell wall assembly
MDTIRQMSTLPEPGTRRAARDDGSRAPGGSSIRRSPALASVLSFVVPGLGQAVAGAWRRGLAIAVPVVMLAAFVAGIWVVDRGLLVRAALTPPILLAIVGASVLIGLYRLWAILDAYAVARARPEAPRSAGTQRSLGVVVLLVVLAATVVMHGYVAYVGWSAHQTLVAVFDPSGPGGGTASPQPTPVASAPTSPGGSSTAAPTATPTPLPTPTPPPAWAADGRLNVLLIGSDAGPGRWSQRADAIILVSVEIATGRVAAFSVPRYTTLVPLPEPAASAFPCRCLAEPINALFVFANQNPGLFPGEGDLKGWMAVSGAIEALFGVQLDGMAVADLNGFVRLVDAVGGITLDIKAEVYDDQYPDPNGVDIVEIYFPVGVQRLDGWHALAYARTRHQDGDVSRMRRQQEVVRALGHELSCNLLLNLPSVLEVARDTLWTNLPLEDVPDMLRIDPGPIESHVLFDIHNPALTADDVARLQAEVANAFDGPPPPDTDPALDC